MAEESSSTSAGLRDLAEQYGIRLILQFGSTVTGREHEHSDLDLAIMQSRADLPLRSLLEIQQKAQALFPGREVDLAVINRADPLFLKKITERCRLLHGVPGDLARLRMYAFKRYQDYRRLLELERRFVAGRLAILGEAS
jgi:predicted nucleotidyltransferase